MLLPGLFKLYTEKVFRDVEDLNRVMIIGININDLRYADDTAPLCFCPSNLQMLIDLCNEAGKSYGMEINTKKTKTIIVSKTSPSPKMNITLEGSPIQQTNSMAYLGSFIM